MVRCERLRRDQQKSTHRPCTLLVPPFYSSPRLTPPLGPLFNPRSEPPLHFALPKASPLTPPEPPHLSSAPRKDSSAGSLTGLFALLQVVKDMEKQPKKSSVKCWNKYCKATKDEDEEGSRRRIAGNFVWLCGRCTQAYTRKQFCEYCKQIYVDTSDKKSVVDGLDWMQCESCKRWTHVLCEKEGRNKDIEAALLDPLFVYHCAECERANPFSRRSGKKKAGHV